MYDMHYDLLSVAYRDLLKGDTTWVEDWMKNYNKNNVTGVIANLYFMSEKEMEEELHPDYYRKDKSVTEMFKIATRFVKKHLPQDIDVIFGVEGCDYIKDIEELEELYNLGLRSICLVWNNENKYGSGNRNPNQGLTKEGIKFIEKAIELGIGIDLSHANEKTFDDIIKICKNKIKNNIYPVVYASHSNCRELCDRERNLSDKQLQDIASINGYVGLMSNKNFVVLKEKQINREQINREYLNHIRMAAEIVGYDHVLLSTDDMSFYSSIDPSYAQLPMFNYSNIRESMSELLNGFEPEIQDQIMYGNAKTISKRLKR